MALIRVGHPGAIRISLALVLFYLGFWVLIASRSRESRKVWAIRFIACTMAILFGIAVFELPALFRLMDYRVLFATPSPPWQRPGNRPDPDLVYLKKGHQRVRESFTGNEVHWLRGAGPSHIYQSDRRYDRYGFRNPSDFDRADVVVLGDSFIEGAHVTEAELITERLAVALGGQTQVVNLGQAGYGPEQERHVLRRFGIPRQPSVCVWAFYEGNDLADIDEYASQHATMAECLRTGRGLTPSFSDRCFSSNALGFVLRTWIDPPPRWLASSYRGTFTDDRSDRVPLYFASGDYRRESVSAKSLDRMCEILRSAYDLCRERGIRLVIVFIPTKLRVYRGSCRFEKGSVCARWPIDDLPQRLGKMTAEISSDLDYLDLTSRFQTEVERGARLYLPDDTHWSSDGHHAAALAIAERLKN